MSMSSSSKKKKVVSKSELLERWRSIEQQDDDDAFSQDELHIRHLKELWFSDAFNFLIYLPQGVHIWCSSPDIMGPLLETFFNYFLDDRRDSPLRLLWKRVSDELQVCMPCICEHHNAKDTYATDYEFSSIAPLLDVLSRLDEERVTNQLKQINTLDDELRVITVMYEVFRFPVLLDDQSLVTHFQTFIEALDTSNELTLEEQYPGVYALLFLKSRKSRSIGFRLAGCMPKLKNPQDLDPLQPLLKKCILFLQTETTPLPDTSRPRMQLDRITVWLGIKAL